MDVSTESTSNRADASLLDLRSALGTLDKQIAECASVMSGIAALVKSGAISQAAADAARAGLKDDMQDLARRRVNLGREISIKEALNPQPAPILPGTQQPNEAAPLGVVYRCFDCERNFVNRGGLHGHLKWCKLHKEAVARGDSKQPPIEVAPKKKRVRKQPTQQPVVQPVAPVVSTPQEVVVKVKRGASVRKSYTLKYKIKVIEAVEAAKVDFGDKIRGLWHKVGDEMGLNKTLVLKWYKGRDKIRSDYQKTKGSRGRGNRGRPKAMRVSSKKGKYPLCEEVVAKKVKALAEKKVKITSELLRELMMDQVGRLQKEVAAGDDEKPFLASKRWLLGFIRRHNIACH